MQDEVTQADEAMALEWAQKVAASKPPRYTEASRNAARYILARHQAERETLARMEAVAPRYRHKKRGTVYEVIGNGVLQCAANPLLDEQPVVIYRGEDGKLWVRGIVEFHDGRFEPITALDAVRGKQ